VARLLAHLDLDAFFCSVEELEQPGLREHPFVVGGDPYGRGVIATANYQARRYGIRSAMSSAEALRRYPELVIVAPTRGRYSAASRRVWDLVRAQVGQVEQAGIDEGYLDLSFCADTNVAAEFCRELQQTIRRETGLSASFGISAVKGVAKICSDLRKPAGISVCEPGSEAALLAPLGLRKLPGVGPVAAAALAAARVVTIGQLASLDDETLAVLLPGSRGPLLRDRARGIDERWLEAPTEPKQISAEDTFEFDLRGDAHLHAELDALAARVGERLAAKGYAARTITLKLKYADFHIRSRSFSLPIATDDTRRIAEVAKLLLGRALADEPGALRLLGIACSRFERDVQLELPLRL
jgi:DNA polymerase-4